MRFRRLVSAIEKLTGPDPRNIRQDAITESDRSPFLSQGILVSLSSSNGVTTLQVAANGKVAKGNLATDEPLRAGQRVWVAFIQESGEFLVLGSVKS